MQQRPDDDRGPGRWLPAVVAAAVAAGATWALSRPGSSLPRAAAQFPAVAGGQGVYLMPGQLATNAWGVYLLDTDRGSLLVYRFDAGSSRLKLLAARDVSADRGLGDFNTFPPPAEVRRIVELERRARQKAEDGGADPDAGPADDRGEADDGGEVDDAP